MHLCRLSEGLVLLLRIDFDAAEVCGLSDPGKREGTQILSVYFDCRLFLLSGNGGRSVYRGRLSRFSISALVAFTDRNRYDSLGLAFSPFPIPGLFLLDFHFSVSPAPDFQGGTFRICRNRCNAVANHFRDSTIRPKPYGPEKIRREFVVALHLSLLTSPA